MWSDKDRQFVRVRYVKDSSSSGPEGSGPYCQLVVGDVEDRLELGVLQAQRLSVCCWEDEYSWQLRVQASDDFRGGVGVG